MESKQNFSSVMKRKQNSSSDIAAIKINYDGETRKIKFDITPDFSFSQFTDVVIQEYPKLHYVPQKYYSTQQHEILQEDTPLFVMIQYKNRNGGMSRLTTKTFSHWFEKTTKGSLSSRVYIIPVDISLLDNECLAVHPEYKTADGHLEDIVHNYDGNCDNSKAAAVIRGSNETNTCAAKRPPYSPDEPSIPMKQHGNSSGYDVTTELKTLISQLDDFKSRLDTFLSTTGRVDVHISNNTSPNKSKLAPDGVNKLINQFYELQYQIQMRFAFLSDQYPRGQTQNPADQPQPIRMPPFVDGCRMPYYQQPFHHHHFTNHFDTPYTMLPHAAPPYPFLPHVRPHRCHWAPYWDASWNGGGGGDRGTAENKTPSKNPNNLFTPREGLKSTFEPRGVRPLLLLLNVLACSSQRDKMELLQSIGALQTSDENEIDKSTSSISLDFPTLASVMSHFIPMQVGRLQRLLKKLRTRLCTESGDASSLELYSDIIDGLKPFFRAVALHEKGNNIDSISEALSWPSNDLEELLENPALMNDAVAKFGALSYTTRRDLAVIIAKKLLTEEKFINAIRHPGVSDFCLQSSANGQKHPSEEYTLYDLVHQSVICDTCKKEPLLGLRWRCLQCYDCDLCASCYVSHISGLHVDTHEFSCRIPSTSLTVAASLEIGSQPMSPNLSNYNTKRDMDNDSRSDNQSPPVHRYHQPSASNYPYPAMHGYDPASTQLPYPFIQPQFPFACQRPYGAMPNFITNSAAPGNPFSEGQMRGSSRNELEGKQRRTPRNRGNKRQHGVESLIVHQESQGKSVAGSDGVDRIEVVKATCTITEKSRDGNTATETFTIREGDIINKSGDTGNVESDTGAALNVSTSTEVNNNVIGKHNENVYIDNPSETPSRKLTTEFNDGCDIESKEEKLVALGYEDRETNMALLKAHNCNLRSAIAELVKNSTPIKSTAMRN